VKFLRKIPSKLEDLARENLGEELNLSLAPEEFEKKLGIGVPEIIEGFDVSHFQGEGTVGSCVVWERGRMNKKRYRKYRIRQSDSGDDYASLREILSRRAKRLRSGEEPVPDLWLLDGGPGQLNVGVEVRDRFGLKLKVMALAKGEEILLTEEGREVKLREEPLLCRIFGLVRDEAHRFALSYSRKLRAKSVMEDVLSKVRGVGDVRRRIIYRNFESLYDLLEADEEQLRKLGLPSQLKQEVRRYLKPFKD
ncbi:MAG TPA: excinuclease ABC subunit C, partial [Aquifex aeolicus]|nr:excinuclease ABC subunit C [Aquifex aeolicus]